MIKLTIHNDQTLTESSSFLQVPSNLVAQLLNNQTNKETRISDDESFVFLPKADHEKLFDRLNQIGESFQTNEINYSGPSFIRSLSKVAWL